MAISIGDAMLKLGVDKGNFDRDMKGIGASIKKHQKAIGIGMVAVGTAIVGVATKSVLSFAAMGDEIAKMAKRTGFTTEALSELRYAAELSGTSLAGVEKASRTLSGAILDAGFGLETYVRAFDKIGLSYEDLKELSPEDQFVTVLEALAGVTDESERAALAADLFGRAGTQLLPMLSDGSEGLKEMREGAHDLGLVFDKEASVAAEKLTDAMTNVKGSITGAGLAIAEALIPILTPLLDKVTDIVKQIAEFAKNNETLTKVITGAGGLLIGLGGVLLILPKLKAAAIALGHTLKTLLLNPIVLLIAALAALGYVTYSLIQKDILANKINKASIKLKEEQAKAEGKLTKEVLEAQKALNELRLEYGKLTPEQEEAILKSQESIALWEEGVYVINETTGALELYDDGLGKTTKETKKLTEAQKKQLAAFRETLGVIGQLFPGGFTEEKWAQWREAGLLTPQAIKGFASGGIVTRPTLAMIGERGPEAVVPLGKGMGTTNIYVELDGRVIARAIGQPLVDEIRLRTGVRM